MTPQNLDEDMQDPDAINKVNPTEDASENSTISGLETDENQKPHGLKRLWRGYCSKKKFTVPLTILLIIAVLMAVPFTRYALLGLFIKQDVPVVVIDSETNKPVSGAKVTLLDISAKTDGEGRATLKSVPVGESELRIQKSYYKETKQPVTVDITKNSTSIRTKLIATGRQVELSVVNKISGQAISGVVIKAGNSEAKTNDEGTATIVLSPKLKVQKAQLSGEGFVNTEINIELKDKKPNVNKFTLTPSGKLYFLSKRSGTIDVVKTNLDGSERQIVLAGTGKEEEGNTVLLASRDWKYLALLSRRDSPQPKLYLIDTATDKLSTIDEGDASFSLTGWHDHDFVYAMTRNQIQVSQPGHQALKVFHAENQKLATLDETTAEGTTAQEIPSGVSLVDKGVVYVKQWQQYGTGDIKTKDASISIVGYDGSGKKDLKTFTSPVYFQELLYKPNEVYFSFFRDNKQNYLEYEGGVIKDASDQSQKFTASYPTYLLSPSGNYALWGEQRDGKNTLLLGDKDGNNGKVLNQTTKHSPYGWYSDEYILLTLEGSELYIAPRQASAQTNYLKVTDYHKPTKSFLGYGGGYGGL